MQQNLTVPGPGERAGPTGDAAELPVSIWGPPQRWAGAVDCQGSQGHWQQQSWEIQVLA